MLTGRPGFKGRQSGTVQSFPDGVKRGTVPSDLSY